RVTTNEKNIATNTQNITNLDNRVTTNETNISTNTQNITKLTTTVYAGWDAQINGTTAKNVNPNSNTLNFVAKDGGNVTIEKGANGEIVFSAIDTDTNTQNTVSAGNNVNISTSTNDDGTTNYQISAVDTDTNTVTNLTAGTNVTVTGGEVDENGNKTYTISATDTNTYLNDVTVDKANNNVNFVRNDGQSYSVNFTAGGGTNGADTFVQIGGANGLTLNTGSKVAGTGVATPDGNATALSGITINGEDFLVPVINANTEPATGEAPYLTSIELNGKTYNIVSQGAATDFTVKAGTYTVAGGQVKLDTLDNLTGNVTQGNIIIDGVASVTQLDALKNEINTNISNHKGSTLVNSTEGLDFENGELTMSVADTGNNSVTGTVNIGGYVSGKINTEAVNAKYNDTLSIGQAISNNTTNIATNKANIATNVTNIATNKAAIEQNAKDIATNKENITSNTDRIGAIEESYVKTASSDGTTLTLTQTGNNGETVIFTDNLPVML
ncbi:MAG: hypothetical protein IIV08_03825, partial [Selenomonadales bacterium]|nr:hypothetical protein [Selenomonadales bacterium]